MRSEAALQPNVPSRPLRAQASNRSIEVELRAEEKQIQYVRFMVHSFVLLSTEDRPLANRVTVTAAELVECACREGGGTAFLRVRLEPGNKRARVEVSWEASLARAQQLERSVAKSNSGNPVDAYTYALAASDNEPDLLAIARVRYEGQMTVAAFRIGQRVSLMAEAPL